MELRCSECGADGPAEARFCVQCGSQMERACPSCGNAVSGDHRFCHSCGAELSASGGAAAAPGPAFEGERRQASVVFSDLSKPPLHTLPLDELLENLHSRSAA